MQWQHGKFQYLANGSLITQPFEVDGRQLLSQPCDYDNGIYTRYNQSELFQVSTARERKIDGFPKQYQQRIELLTDPYHNIPRLNLYRFDGSPVMPLYMAYNPPQMLPTSTINPTTSGATAKPTSSKFRVKRSLSEWGSALSKPTMQPKQGLINPNFIWWFGVGATGLGSVMYFCF